jgi:hypothetical protein
MEVQQTLLVKLYCLNQLIGSIFQPFIKKLLQHYEQNVTPLSQEDEYKTQFFVQKNKSFFIFFL